MINLSLWAQCTWHCFNLMFSNWVIQGWTFYKTVFNLQLALLFSVTRIGLGVNGIWLGHASQNLCSGLLSKNLLNLIPEADTQKLVSLYIFIGIGQKFMSSSQWIRGNQAAMAIYGWLFIVHFQLLGEKLTFCWIKCRFSKLPEAFRCTRKLNCRCTKSSWINEDKCIF